MIKAIPRVPNNRESLTTLQNKSLTDLLIIFINWQLRFVRQGKRKVVIDESAKRDSRWTLLNGKIELFLDKVRTGEDLTPFLSLQASKRGFSLAANNPLSSTDTWDDKDFLLNIMGYHHFHLGGISEGSSCAERTDDVLFAHITRDIFTVLAVLNHSVFESPDDLSQSLTSDRKYLWSIFDERSMRGTMPGSIVMPSMIAASGHTWSSVKVAQNYVRVIREIDPKLDDIVFVHSLYENTDIEEINSNNLVWCLRHLDLCIIDNSSGFFGVFRNGPN